MTDAKSKVKIVAVITTIFGTRALEVKRITMSIVKCGGFGSPDEDVKSQKGSGSKTRKKHTEVPFWSKARMTCTESCEACCFLH
jgi:hypothetical protein